MLDMFNQVGILSIKALGLVEGKAKIQVEMQSTDFTDVTTRVWTGDAYELYQELGDMIREMEGKVKPVFNEEVDAAMEQGMFFRAKLELPTSAPTVQALPLGEWAFRYDRYEADIKTATQLWIMPGHVAVQVVNPYGPSLIWTSVPEKPIQTAADAEAAMDWLQKIAAEV